ncbi:uncharacterized protein V1510DRAFT_417496 [Dipodascopsis tothii]|uniref:uncharacterized protein n=1 Tax=Dipodascopsis tothii TaxID=44089 RepID=UPI0034CE75B8
MDMIVLSTGNVSHEAQGPQDVGPDLARRAAAWADEPRAAAPAAPVRIGPPAVAPLVAPRGAAWDAEDDGRLELTAKIFFAWPAPGTAPAAAVAGRVAAARAALAELALTAGQPKTVDILVLSFPEIVFSPDDEDDADEGALLAAVSDTWLGVTRAPEAAGVARFAVAEFSTARLAALVAFCAAQSCPRPALNQINVRDCCALPPSLLELAKTADVKLVAHNDAFDVLPQTAVAGVLAPVLAACPALPAAGWAWAWLVKATVIVTNRGVVAANGWIAGFSHQ